MTPRPFLRAAVASVLFLLLSVLMLPYPGIQDDEVLFTTPLYLHIEKQFRVRILHHDLFLMVMSYIGALKTMLFAPVFAAFGANRWSLRLPVVLFGAATVFLFYLLAERANLFELGRGSRAATLGALLLATDPVFLLTNTFDWGPVALEHLLLVTAAFCLLRFGQTCDTETERNLISGLTLGFFCLGLALWNKAIFIWSLCGLSVATLLVFPGEIRRLSTRRHWRLAAVAFLVGALPLIVYNLRHKSATLSENAHFDARGPAAKWTQLESALNGSSLFGYMVSEEWRPQPKPALSAVGRASTWLRERLGERLQTGFYYALGLLIVAVPLWWSSRAARFSLVFCAVTWLAMALTKDAGGSAHHVVLLWPFPVLFAAIAISNLARFQAPAVKRGFPWGAGAALLLGVALVTMNLVVLNQYLVQFERNGPAETFTDAIYRLSDDLRAFDRRPIYVIDWGMLNVLAFLHQGRLDLKAGSEPLMTDAPSELQEKVLRLMISDPEAVFVGHVAGEEMFPKVNQRLDRAAQRLGFRKQVLKTVADSNGRPRFEIFRLLTSDF